MLLLEKKTEPESDQDSRPNSEFKGNARDRGTNVLNTVSWRCLIDKLPRDECATALGVFERGLTVHLLGQA